MSKGEWVYNARIGVPFGLCPEVVKQHSGSIRVKMTSGEEKAVNILYGLSSELWQTVVAYKLV